MIAKISGILSFKSIEYIITDINGIGYKIFVPYSTYYHLPEKGCRLTLHTYTHLRNDAIALFGFLTEEEKKLFEALIGVSKIGPKLATNILSGTSVEELETAISGKDIEKINSIPGVGRKTAERIVLELKDKIACGSEKADELSKKDEEDDVFLDCVSALVNLGYHKKAAAEAVKKTRESMKDASFEEIIRSSLKALVK